MNYKLTKEEKETKDLMGIFSLVLWVVSIISYIIIGKFILEIFNLNEVVVVLFTATITSIIYVDVIFQLTKYWKQPYHDRLDKEFNEKFNQYLNN